MNIGKMVDFGSGDFSPRLGYGSEDSPAKTTVESDDICGVT
ncbi:hypothetical protein BRCON_1565 [Candidatus Sumerlaea chitinivorans]|uniref:Uncharacterized protein n=1 Tax=Sumerlaea chitinivorans TaxID=2250252 RepID=A0A2Z4Y6J9_SUMC1|nr:hypothetical protein BRCON_1565 [Candidatus Sumerlaea chitinivorans]